MEILFLPNGNLENYFKDNQLQQQLVRYCQTKLPIYVTQRSIKIKPVHGALAHLFELKVRVGREFYRLAYFYQDQLIQVAYLSTTLQKVRFDHEVNHYLKQVNHANNH